MRFLRAAFAALMLLVACIGLAPAQQTENDVRKIDLYCDFDGLIKQVDFSKENVLSFQWTGAREDSLSFVVEMGKAGTIVVFTLKPGAIQIPVFHNHLYVIAKNANWRTENDKSKLTKATQVTNADELAKALARKPPLGVPPEMKVINVPQDLPDIAVPFGCHMIPARREPISHADLKSLARRKNLTYLLIEGNVGETDVPAAGLKELAAAENLTHLTIGWSKVTDAGFKELGRLKNLTTLELVCTPVSEQGLRELAPLKKLDTLRIDPAEEINDKTLRALRDIGLLHALLGAKGNADARPQSADAVLELKLFDTKMTDAGLKELTVFKNLTALDVGTMMRFFDVNDNLQAIYKDFGGGLTDAGLKELVHFKKLASLGLRGTAVSSAGMKELAALKNLTVLDLGDTKVTDAGLKDLPSSLTSLALAGSRGVSDAGLRNLTHLKNLTTLDVRDTGVSGAGLAELGKALPKLTTVRFGSRIEDSKSRDDPRQQK